MVGETELSFDDGLAFFALVNSLTEHFWVFIEKEEGEASDKLLLACSDYTHFILVLLEDVVEHLDWTPHVLLVFIDGRQAMSLLGPGLAIVNPLFGGFVFFPCIISCECFHTCQVRVTVKDLVFLLQNLEGLLGRFVLISFCNDLLEECFFSDNVFMLFNDICMSGRQTLILNYLRSQLIRK